jgi:hypothetical protein
MRFASFPVNSPDEICDHREVGQEEHNLEPTATMEQLVYFQRKQQATADDDQPFSPGLLEIEADPFDEVERGIEEEADAEKPELAVVDMKYSAKKPRGEVTVWRYVEAVHETDGHFRQIVMAQMKGGDSRGEGEGRFGDLVERDPDENAAFGNGGGSLRIPNLRRRRGVTLKANDEKDRRVNTVASNEAAPRRPRQATASCSTWESASWPLVRSAMWASMRLGDSVAAPLMTRSNSSLMSACTARSSSCNLRR